MTSLSAPTERQLFEAVNGKTVLITGGASGIGLATAQLLASAGGKVTIADFRDEQRLAEASKVIGHGCAERKCDVSSWTQQANLFEGVRKEHGSIDVVFLNAGRHTEMKVISGGVEGEEASRRVESNFLADEREESGGALREPCLDAVSVNRLGTIYGIKLAIHHMKQQPQGGRIIVMASADAYMAIPSSPIYDASKHGVLGLTRSVCQQSWLQEAGITIGVLCPSLTRTAMTESISDDLIKGIPSSEPKDVAQGVAYLLAAASSRAHGATILVKGQSLIEVEAAYREWMLPFFAT